MANTRAPREPSTFAAGFETFFSFIGAILIFIVLGLLGLYALISIVKRMWELA